MRNLDFLIIGGGVIGLTLAYRLKTLHPHADILLLEKEFDVAQHASGLNSGVLHAGFYYTGDSLKAQLCREGNLQMKLFCKEQGIPVNECGKVVVCQNQAQLKTLHELYERGQYNQVPLELINEAQLERLEPLAKTYQKALFSPTTAVVDPKKVCQRLKQLCIQNGVKILFDEPVLTLDNHNQVCTRSRHFKAHCVINAAGLYADKLAQMVGLSKNKIVLPFKGRYLKSVQKSQFKRHIYPVPNIEQPFLGVHYTLTADAKVKIGPTAIPAFWRENYDFKNFNLAEFQEISRSYVELLKKNQFGFRRLAWEESKKYYNPYLKRVARSLVKRDLHDYQSMAPGIRAQLYDLDNQCLEMDFVIEKKANSIHILNAVSPAFTCAFSFTDYVIKNYIYTKEVQYAA